MQLTEDGLHSHHGPNARKNVEEEHKRELERVPILNQLMEEEAVMDHLMKDSLATSTNVQLTEVGLDSHHGLAVRLPVEEGHRLEKEGVPILHLVMEENPVREILVKARPATSTSVHNVCRAKRYYMGCWKYEVHAESADSHTWDDTYPCVPAWSSPALYPGLSCIWWVETVD